MADPLPISIAAPLPWDALKPPMASIPIPAPTIGAVMPSASPVFAAPSMPEVTRIPTQPENDLSRLNMMKATGAGVDQIQNPILHGIAKGLDIAGSIAGNVFMPARGIVTAIPGTTLHHNFLVHQQEGLVANDQATAQAQQQLADEQAQEKQTEALTNYTQQRPAIEQSKIDQKQTANQNSVTQRLTNAGFKPQFDENGQLVDAAEDPNSSVVQKRQAATQLADAQITDTNAQEQLRDAQTAFEQSKNDPNSPAFKLALGRLNVAQQNAATARGNLGVRTNEYKMHAFGTDANGHELPGVLHDTNGTPIGSVQASNVRPTATQRDAAGRADSMVDIGNRIREALKDPEIQSYLGPIQGHVSEVQGNAGILPENVSKFRNDLISYGAFQAGLHPVRGIGGLQYFDKVMGGLHQTPEELAGKLNSNDETAASVQKVGDVPTAANRATPTPHGAGNSTPVKVFNPKTGRLE